MLMKFTQDCGRYRRGEWRDWPSQTWEGVASSVGLPLDQIAVAVKPETEGYASETRQMTERAPSVSVPKRRGRPPKVQTQIAVEG